MNIQFDDNQLKSVLSEAILQTLDQQKRDALIQAAMSHLLAPDGSYGKKQSPIERAFLNAAEGVAHRMIATQLETDAGFTEKLCELFAEAMVRVFETNREKTLENLTRAITAGLAYER